MQIEAKPLRDNARPSPETSICRSFLHLGYVWGPLGNSVRPSSMIY